MKIIYVVLSVVLMGLVGCGGGSADTEKPVSEVKSEAATLTVADLKAKAADYQSAIQSKLQEIEPIKEQLANIPLAEKLGDEAKALQADISTLTQDLNALKERLAVYVDALKAQGESVSEYLK